MVVDTIGKYLPGNREAMSAGSFRLLKLQTGGRRGDHLCCMHGY